MLSHTKEKRALPKSSREHEIIEAYESWDPDELSITELVESLGISRQRLYGVLDKHDVTPKSRRNSPVPSPVDTDLIQEMAEMALGYLVTQLQEARSELAKYRERHGPLDAD